jgi:hypothetical protein
MVVAATDGIELSRCSAGVCADAKSASVSSNLSVDGDNQTLYNLMCEH